MKKLLAILFIIFITSALSCLYADDYGINDVSLYKLNNYFSQPNTSSKIKFSKLIDRYNLNQIEAYIENQYGTYKSYATYITSKQQEIASKFGLSNIYIRPNLRQYENTELVMVKHVWKEKITLRYLAPLGNMGDFEIYMAFRPKEPISLIFRNEMNGNRSVAAAINYSFGRKNKDNGIGRQTKHILNKITKIKI